MLLASAVALGGCDNSCQAFCTTLAEYADECGTQFTEADIATCEDALSSPESEELQACRDYGTPDRLRLEWSCEDVNLYRENGGG